MPDTAVHKGSDTFLNLTMKKQQKWSIVALPVEHRRDEKHFLFLMDPKNIIKWTLRVKLEFSSIGSIKSHFVRFENFSTWPSALFFVLTLLCHRIYSSDEKMLLNCVEVKKTCQSHAGSLCWLMNVAINCTCIAPILHNTKGSLSQHKQMTKRLQSCLVGFKIKEVH